MDRDSALDFLRRRQPMPSDNELTDETIAEYDEARKFFIANPDPVCIPLFLNSFGDGSGFGVYQLVEDVFRSYRPSEVVPHLYSALQSKYPSVRYWSAQIAWEYSQPEIFGPLRDLLLDRKDESGARIWAAMALEYMDDDRVDATLNEALREETDDAIRAELLKALQTRRLRRLING